MLTTLAFWIVVELVLLFLFTVGDKFFVNTLSLVIFAGVIAIYPDFRSQALPYLQSWELKDYVIAFIVYYTIGLLWGLFKWDSFVAAYYRNWPRKRVEKEKVEVTKHAGKIAGWISYWPFSVIAYIVGDLVIRVGDFIVDKTKTIFQKIADRHIQD